MTAFFIFLSFTEIRVSLIFSTHEILFLLHAVYKIKLEIGELF